MRLKTVLIALFLAGAFAARSGQASHPPGFSLQIYSAPGYFRLHPHHPHYYPRYWHDHGHRRFRFPGPDYYAPRYRYGYYPPGLNINWRRFRCD
ncbi:hypothetical protein JCM13664_11060 [Methylothermus subterraneus]